MFRRVVLGAALLLISGSAFAIDPPGWVGPTNIERLVVQPNGRMYVKIGGSTPDLGCAGNLDGWLEFDTAAPFFKEQCGVHG